MYIRRKVFSILTNEEGEERLYSVKEVTFAKKDYEGLTEEGKKILREKRSAYAKSLLKNYRDTMAGIDNVGGNYNQLRSTGSLSGGGMKTSYEVITNKGTADSAENFINTHKSSIRKELGKQAKNAGELMRTETMFGHRVIPKAEPIAQEVKDSLAKKAEEAEAIKNQVKKKGFKLSRNQKIGIAALGAAALAGAGTYAYKKHKKSKEKKD